MGTHSRNRSTSSWRPQTRSTSRRDAGRKHAGKARSQLELLTPLLDRELMSVSKLVGCAQLDLTLLSSVAKYFRLQNLMSVSQESFG